MSLLIMCCHDTDTNGRFEFTLSTLKNLVRTVDFKKHRLVIVDNDSCENTKEVIKSFVNTHENISVITNPENIGTAKAVNLGIKLRQPGEFCVKLDNDINVDRPGWVEQMEEVITRMPTIGVLGLKRVDLGESVYSVNTDQRSRLLEVKHEPGQRWYVVEECKHVMGTCTMLNPALLDKVGYFYQMNGLYGFDDSLMCVRSNVAGFLNCFLHGINIDHIDPGGNPYVEWKQKVAGDMLSKYGAEEAAYRAGLKDVYHED